MAIPLLMIVYFVVSCNKIRVLIGIYAAVIALRELHRFRDKFCRFYNDLGFVPQGSG
jgi:hypothetical protein